MENIITVHYHPIPQRNYLDKEMFATFDSWQAFRSEFGGAVEFNLIYRFDFFQFKNLKKEDETYFAFLNGSEEYEELDEFSNFVVSERGFTEGINLQLSIVQQRKGNLLLVFIKNIKECELAEIEAYLKGHFQYILEIWKPFNAVKDGTY